jgi:hypothetical protein
MWYIPFLITYQITQQACSRLNCSDLRWMEHHLPEGDATYHSIQSMMHPGELTWGPTAILYIPHHDTPLLGHHLFWKGQSSIWLGQKACGSFVCKPWIALCIRVRLCKFMLVMSPPAAPDTRYGDYVVFGVGMASLLGHEAVEFRVSVNDAAQYRPALLTD